MITGPIRQDGPIDHIIKIWHTYNGWSYHYNWNYIWNCFVGRFNKHLCLDLIFVSLSLGLLGLLDDVLKIKFKNSSGLKSRYKF